MTRGNSLVRGRMRSETELQNAIAEARRKSVYRFLPTMATVETTASRDPPGADPSFEASAERAEEHFEKEPVVEQKAEEEKLDYPEAAAYEGTTKVRTLAGLILKDGSIDKDLKRKRLNYLIALNARNKWTSDEEVRHIVEESINSLGA